MIEKIICLLLEFDNLLFRHETLISLLNKLSTYFYDHSPIELDQRRTVNPEYIKKLSINRAWYLSQVKARCRYGCEGMDAAKLLSKLEYEELTGLMSQKDFDKLVLKDCILWGLNQIRIHGLVEEPSLVKAAVHCLLKEVSRTRSLFPKPHQVSVHLFCIFCLLLSVFFCFM